MILPPGNNRTGNTALKIKYHIQQPDYPVFTSGTPLSAGDLCF